MSKAAAKSPATSGQRSVDEELMRDQHIVTSCLMETICAQGDYVCKSTAHLPSGQPAADRGRAGIRFIIQLVRPTIGPVDGSWFVRFWDLFVRRSLAESEITDSEFREETHPWNHARRLG